MNYQMVAMEVKVQDSEIYVTCFLRPDLFFVDLLHNMQGGFIIC